MTISRLLLLFVEWRVEGIRVVVVVVVVASKRLILNPSDDRLLCCVEETSRYEVISRKRVMVRFFLNNLLGEPSKFAGCSSNDPITNKKKNSRG